MQGEYVRSKSELHIANMLFMEKIPYRYEDRISFETGHSVLDPEAVEILINKYLK